MKRLFSYVACVLFVHSVSASELTIEQFMENLTNKYTMKNQTEKLHEYTTKFEPELTEKIKQGGLRKDDDPDKILINVINNATNNDKVSPTIRLMYCCILTTHGTTDESKRKGKQLFQEILQKAKIEGKDIYSFEFVE